MARWQSKREARFDLTVSGTDADAIHRALIDWLMKVVNELNNLDQSEWDDLVFEHGCQTGTVTSWLHKRNAKHRDQPPLAVCLRLKSWQDTYNSLPDPDDAGDKFTRAYDRMLKKQVASVKRAINDPKVKPRFTKLKKKKDFVIFSAGEDDVGREDCWQFLWGNRPPKREFANSRELFTHLCRKAHLCPEGFVRGRGDHVTGITWRGEAFSDDQVDFLESVPDVNKLCARLKNFRIEHTRVTAPGLDRLRALLPNTNIRVVGGR